jgi:RNA polymerase sigma-70 factor (ECF subfamily)
MLSRKDRQRFERMSLPHLNAAYNLALWLVRDPTEADDIVQTAYMRAFEGFNNFTGNNIAAWLMTIVRNTAFNVLNKRKRNSNLVSFDEVIHHSEQQSKNMFELTPEEMITLVATRQQVSNLIDHLPVEFKEALFLREIEGYSYKEISEITQVPKGTVMSRLSRARGHLQKLVLEQQRKEQASEL